MGNTSLREKMLDAIEKSRIDKVDLIINQYPQILNEDLSKDIRATPLARAVWRNDFEMTDFLLKKGAQINEGGSQKISPIMWAAKRDNAYMLSNLLDAGADLNLVSNEGYTALDYAIVHGNYRPALFIYHFCQDLKDYMDYYQFAKDRDYRYVNYEIFITQLKMQTPYGEIPNYFKRPESKQKDFKKFNLEPRLIDPVVDPRETWGSMVSRIIEFEDPPLVERDELPKNLQPQNRFWGKVRCQINGLDPNPPERKISQDEGVNLQERQFQPSSNDGKISQAQNIHVHDISIQ